jgi:Flp pilus assembly protein TadG
MRKQLLARQRRRERGQTIILVAISLVSLLAMAALAIDIVTLYVASSQIQRATDAAALAGAKAIADSGLTSLQSTDINYATAQTLAQTMAIQAINAMVTTAGVNLVGGQLPVLGGSPTFDLGVTHPGSYQVTVSLTSATLPTFFSKIWSRSGTTVIASATAEAYNPSNLPTMTPIALKSVKPWLVANLDPRTSGPFVTNGVVEQNVIGNPPIDLISDCNSLSSTPCTPLNAPPAAWTLAPKGVYYLPALVTTPNTPNVCPLCAGATDYEQSIECADVATSYQVLSCGGGAAYLQWDSTVNPGAPPNGNNATPLGAECLIHASNYGPLQGQDLLDPSPWPSNPMQIRAQSGPQNGNLVTTSNSIVTIPIFDQTPFTPTFTPTTVTVVGFLQAFINQVDLGPSPPAGSINITVLNIAGCSSTNNGANPVVGGSGTSPIPVRLITSP